MARVLIPTRLRDGHLVHAQRWRMLRSRRTRLRISAETVRMLSAVELTEAAGGRTRTWISNCGLQTTCTDQPK
jgi:hypothetical protein